ncbi:universal stress protein UspA [Methanoculleus taiwanensis]|uniref:Universal stress protein UspA n=1 Tax=Methanoculleus taiwanensis TaxID=1550565 RepID=A0A498H059_9EURY|nr:universal stress protein [Methanoculleus taiwanensis]RXE55725.1 universal stress protein UspA [Methanoculleus taiwanensis]
MFRTILLATDGSENARRATEAAVTLAGELSHQVTVVVVHVATSPPSQSRLVRANFDVHALLEEDARQVVRGTLDRLEAAGVSSTLKVALGEPVTEILAVAKKENADLIVIGSRGLGAIRGAVMGSVSQKIAQTADCPVMIVR